MKVFKFFSSKILLETFSILLFCLSLQGLYRVFVNYDQTVANKNFQNSRVLGTKDQKIVEFPTRLVIPAIKVDARIQLIGVTPDGEMGVPDNILDVGWYKLGPRPGEIGSAVISGHLNGKEGEKGVFVDLYKLKGGDKLYIEDNNGNKSTFVVREGRLYPPGFADEVFTLVDSAHLNLVTCGGYWNINENSYSKRLVVFTDKESN